MSTLSKNSPPRPEPAWEVATLFPSQGEWSEADYMELTAHTNHFVEFVDGYIEVLPMPTKSHQRIVLYLLRLLDDFVRATRAGEVIPGAYKVRLRQKLLREPDILFISRDHADCALEFHTSVMDLAIEVVSPDRESHIRDWNTKREEYAQAGVHEYWIVDPQLKKIVVLKLAGDAYDIHAEAGETGCVSSALLPNFEVDASAVWAAANDPT